MARLRANLGLALATIQWVVSIIMSGFILVYDGEAATVVSIFLCTASTVFGISLLKWNGCTTDVVRVVSAGKEPRRKR